MTSKTKIYSVLSISSHSWGIFNTHVKIYYLWHKKYLASQSTFDTYMIVNKSKYTREREINGFGVYIQITEVCNHQHNAMRSEAPI